MSVPLLATASFIQCGASSLKRWRQRLDEVRQVAGEPPDLVRQHRREDDQRRRPAAGCDTMTISSAAASRDRPQPLQRVGHGIEEIGQHAARR